MAVEYEISSDVATIKDVAPNTQVARVVSLYSGQITYDDEAGSKFATATIDGKSQRVMLCIAVNGTVNYDDVPCLYSTVDGHRCLNIVAPTETGTPDDVPSVCETVVIDGMNVRAVRCILINATPVYDGVSSTCTFTGDDGKTHTAQLVNKITGGSVEVIVKGVAPLSLPDAIANSLSYVKAFGGTEQRNLPDGYIQRQFIYMMDDSYLVPDIIPESDWHIEMDFQTTSVSTAGVRDYFGGRYNSSSAGAGIRFGHTAARKVVMYGFDTNNAYTGSTYNMADNTRYKYVYNNSSASLSTGGTVVDSTTFTPNDTTTSAIGINSYRGPSGSYSSSTEGVYLYSFKAWNGQGELVADYVPAVQKGTVPVVGFYDTVSGTFKTATAGTFAAGGEAVPTPDTPMDIVSNNGVLKVYTNLVDSDIIRTNIDSSGTIVEYSNPSFITHTAPVIPGKTYTCNAVVVFAYYTSKPVLGSVSYDSRRTASQETTFTVPDDPSIKYVAFRNAYEQSVLVEGDTISNLDKVYADGTVETINVHGKNLYNEATKTVGNSIGATGVIGVNADFCISDFIPAKPNTTYTFSGINRGVSTTNHRLHAYDANQQWIEQVDVVQASTNSLFAATGTTPANTAYLRTSTRKSDTEVQVELGSTATTYAQYYDGGTATAEMLLKVGDYQDVQSIIDGVVTRNVGVKVLDGTETGWLQNAAVSGYYYLRNANMVDIDITADSGICSHFKFSSTHAATTLAAGEYTTGIENNIKRLMFRTDVTMFPTLEDFKSWLADQYAAGTPVIVIYPLETPTTESVAGQTLQVTDGDNVLEITQASLNNLELEAEYQAAVSLTIQEVQDANLDPNVQVTIQ